MKWLAINFSNKDGGSVPITEITSLIDRLQKMNKDRGNIFTLNYIKNCRSDLLNFLSKNKIKSGQVSLTSDGIPKILNTLIPLVRSESYLAIAMILTVLYSTRALKLGGPVNLDSITQPQKGDVPNISLFMGSF